eukprot:2272437-Amphidinium_carterae.1
MAGRADASFPGALLNASEHPALEEHLEQVTPWSVGTAINASVCDVTSEKCVVTNAIPPGEEVACDPAYTCWSDCFLLGRLCHMCCVCHHVTITEYGLIGQAINRLRLSNSRRKRACRCVYNP